MSASVTALLLVASVFVLLMAWAVSSVHPQDGLAPIVSRSSNRECIVVVGVALIVIAAAILFHSSTEPADKAVEVQTENTESVTIAPETRTISSVEVITISREIPATPSPTAATPRAEPQRTRTINYLAFPKPPVDNGRGLHWFPTLHQDASVIDRFVPELLAMHIKWLTIIQGLDDYEKDGNVYLVQRLLQNGIMPVMRIEARIGAMDLLRFRHVVARYRALGVSYFQIYNEPNLPQEWDNGHVESPDQFYTLWLKAAEIVVDAKAYPGIAAMSPDATISDFDYLSQLLDWLKKSSRWDMVQRTWLSVHNYTTDYPENFVADESGYGRYRRYATMMKSALGFILPMIGTEGGLASGADSKQSAWTIAAFQALQSREPYWLSYSPWLIGNAVGGGGDPRWESAAWFQVDNIAPVVGAVQKLP